MPSTKANGLDIVYETFGKKSDPALLLVMGLGGQLTMWPEALCKQLAEKNLYVIRYDNRDIGLSSFFDDKGVPNIMEMFADFSEGKPVKGNPYKLSDMAADAVGLLDALQIKKAHIAGVSMGGMIVQHIAFGFPERVLSMTSIMSSSGNSKLPQATPEASAALLAPPPEPFSFEAAVEMGVNTWKAIGSPAYPRPEAELRDWIAQQVKRSFHPDGTARQLAAILADGDRTERLKTIQAPSVVLHGKADPLVRVEAGEDTAKHIKGAELRLVEGMGHDIAEPLFPEFVAAISRAVERAA